jgi:LL-diaminopimelate aminotransferase
MRSKRLDSLPPYLFVEIDRLKQAFMESGRDVYDLGIGDPDVGPPQELVEALRSAATKPRHHLYPPDRGLPELIDAIRHWALASHGVSLDPSEILVTIGSKEAIGHLPLAVVDPGEVVIVPDPGYPVYYSSAVFAGADGIRLPLRRSNGFLPDLGEIDPTTAEQARLIYLNYPNNPTSVLGESRIFSEACDFCRKNGIILVNDAAYSEVTYDRPFEPLFTIARQREIPYIELFSFSKTFSITGWRIGFAIGSPDVISSLAKIKANLDSGVFGAIQEAVAEIMMTSYDSLIGRTRAIYGERRSILAAALEKTGLDFSLPEATFYFWIGTPEGKSSIDFCRTLLEETGIVATPGVGFGSSGEGFFRLSITTATETISSAGEKLSKELPRIIAI